MIWREEAGKTKQKTEVERSGVVRMLAQSDDNNNEVMEEGLGGLEAFAQEALEKMEIFVQNLSETPDWKEEKFEEARESPSVEDIQSIVSQYQLDPDASSSCQALCCRPKAPPNSPLHLSGKEKHLESQSFHVMFTVPREKPKPRPPLRPTLTSPEIGNVQICLAQNPGSIFVQGEKVWSPQQNQQ